MALIDLINQYGINSTADAQAAGSAGSQELGKEDFLQLLVAQLKNQDPLDPVKNEQFVAQLAQFNSLEQMINLNKSFSSLLSLQSLSYASSFIGKEVAWLNDKGETQSGTVKEVELDGQSPMLNIEGNLLIDPGQVIAIGEPTA